MVVRNLQQEVPKIETEITNKLSKLEMDIRLKQQKAEEQVKTKSIKRVPSEERFGHN